MFLAYLVLCVFTWFTDVLKPRKMIKSDHFLHKTKKTKLVRQHNIICPQPFIAHCWFKEKKNDYINCAGELIKLALAADGSLITHDLVKVQGYNLYSGRTCYFNFY